MASSILLTGGTGSFGRAFLKKILSQQDNYKRVVVYSRDELKQWELQQLFPPETYPQLRFFLGDIRDPKIKIPSGNPKKPDAIVNNLNNIKESIQKNLDQMSLMSRDEIFLHRKNKFLLLGRNKGFSSSLESEENLAMKDSLLDRIKIKFKKFQYEIIILILFVIFSIYFFL